MLQGQRLRHMRERRVLSQRALGTLVGQDGKYLSKLELGILRSVTTTTLTRLVTALQVSANDLLGCSDCETLLPRRSGTSTPGRRQRTTATRLGASLAADTRPRGAIAGHGVSPNGHLQQIKSLKFELPYGVYLCTKCHALAC